MTLRHYCYIVTLWHHSYDITGFKIYQFMLQNIIAKWTSIWTWHYLCALVNIHNVSLRHTFIISDRLWKGQKVYIYDLLFNVWAVVWTSSPHTHFVWHKLCHHRQRSSSIIINNVQQSTIINGSSQDYDKTMTQQVCIHHQIVLPLVLTVE